MVYMKERLENVYAVCVAKIFHKNDFTIAKFTDISSSVGEQEQAEKTFSLKGNYIIEVGDKVRISGNLDKKQQSYGVTYWSDTVKRDIDLNRLNSDEIIHYLETLSSPTIAQALYDTLPNVIDALNTADRAALLTVKGVGESTVDRMLSLHVNQLDDSEALAKLAPYGFTKGAIKQIVRHYGNPDLAIKKVQENVYSLSEVRGFGFRRCDDAFITFNKPTQETLKDNRRVIAYIDYMLDEEFSNRNTWVSPKQLVDKILEFIPGADIVFASKHISDSDDYVVIDHPDGKRITKTKFFKMETLVANKIMALIKADVPALEGIEESIDMTEAMQGFRFDESQRQAILDMTANNFFLLQGLGGTGKSSSVKGFVNVARENGLMIGQGALSGKAAKNLEIVTGLPASTIHRLIGYGRENPHNEENPMPYDVVIIDEISMVSLDIFAMLVKAMKPTCRLILVGDNGQLPSIGAGVSYALISSSVPQTTLRKIHRQAKNSAIVTHSIAIRGGIKHPEAVVESETSSVYGVNQDMEYAFVSNKDDESIVKIAMKRFVDLVAEHGVDDVQILTPTRSNVTVLNKYAQLAVNPRRADKLAVTIEYKENNSPVTYDLRVGDRVINTANNYNTKDIDGEEVPIFNGNTGKIIDIQTERKDTYLIIDFEGVGLIKLRYDKGSSDIQLGYAISVHKSQGSTLKAVVVALPFHFMLNTRELLYTAITRASKFCSLITSPRTLKATIDKELSLTEQTNLEYLLSLHVDMQS